MPATQAHHEAAVRMGKAYFLGLDLGQAADYTALAVAEKSFAPHATIPDRYVSRYGIRYLKRWQLRTSYVDIVADVKRLVSMAPLSWPVLALDLTGVGRPVLDLMRRAEVPANLRPVSITGGMEAKIGEDGFFRVPKRELASRLQVLLQGGRLTVANLPERKVLLDELLAFKVKVNIATGNESFEAWRERDHDDLVLAVALAVWLGEHAGGGVVATPLDLAQPERERRSLAYVPGSPGSKLMRYRR